MKRQLRNSDVASPMVGLNENDALGLVDREPFGRRWSDFRIVDLHEPLLLVQSGELLLESTADLLSQQTKTMSSVSNPLQAIVAADVSTPRSIRFVAPGKLKAHERYVLPDEWD
jgi:hypothetical protein